LCRVTRLSSAGRQCPAAIASVTALSTLLALEEEEEAVVGGDGTTALLEDALEGLRLAVADSRRGSAAAAAAALTDLTAFPAAALSPRFTAAARASERRLNASIRFTACECSCQRVHVKNLVTIHRVAVCGSNGFNN